MKSCPMRVYLHSRFSSAEQRKGNSLSRQRKFARRFCEEKGIALDETQAYTDKGVSGLKGKNHQTGALSLFIQACEQKRIGHGSYLIVENLDRLSREHPLDALHLVRTLVKTHGITLAVMPPDGVVGRQPGHGRRHAHVRRVQPGELGEQRQVGPLPGQQG
jgi:DNA invertase Pin-like site-specific DNA recombinase